MNDAVTPSDPRAAAARAWAVAQLGLSACEFAPASADASFRRYFRVTAAGGSWVVMDAPPERENCEPFIRVAGLMKDAGLHVPEILAQDLVRGYLLLSDLGRQTYLHVIDETNADALFADAIDALVRLQAASRPAVLPPYDRALLDRELALFPDWFVGRHLGRTLTAEETVLWQAACALLLDSALDQPRVYVHRDWMPRNLMQSTPNPGVLDFQDAVEGPVTYDPVCLFKDAFLSWPQARIDGWVAQYRAKAAAAGIPMPGDFERAFDWMGVQRHLKVLGVFARIRYRDGKPHYNADSPRFIRYVRDVASRWPELAPLVALFDSLGLHA
ncbi:MAG TPA: phosphotransferase [Nevskiaceae bacterium]|nr:phosphotransferase [Nevskiaceae bacterium]